MSVHGWLTGQALHDALSAVVIYSFGSDLPLGRISQLHI